MEPSPCLGMLDQLLAYMRCPGCAGADLRREDGGLFCRPCGARYPLRQGILNMIGEAACEVITPFQRMMQTPALVSIYEKVWRRLGYFVASSRPFRREIDTILRLQRGHLSGRILDLACGTGVFTRPLAGQARGWVVGLDLSWPMLLQAHRLLERSGTRNVFLIRGSAFRLPFVAGAFDCINCCGALHLFDQPEQALGEIRRVLHKAGYLSVQTTIRPEHSAGMAYLLERFIRFGFFGEMELRESMRRHGLKVLDGERHRISCTILARPA